MSDQLTIKHEALAPLFAAWEEPNRHRARAEAGDGAVTREGRRPTNISIAQHLRPAVKEWRDNDYFGVSDTSRYLLRHWFGGPHDRAAHGGPAEFRYYFCQREAIETLIYLKEFRRLECLSQLIAEFHGGTFAEMYAAGVQDDEDAWSRYAFKMATGSGKTKVMSLAIVWSYFHALRESESELARHFVVIAPNLTVFERLKEDFKPEGGGPDIFDRDPLIPTEWRGDWNLTTVLQDEAGGASTAGVLYLTNIHRLFDTANRKDKDDSYSWVGPTVSKAKALDTGAELRERITGHARVMVLNDEAHHVWDPDSAWNEAIRFLHETIQKRTGGGLTAQLDFSATPKDNKAQPFKHIVCDTPLGEAVDAGIVKTPIIGRAGHLVIQATDNAAFKYEAHLRLGYQRWLKSKEEWQASGKKPLLFVMCEDTKAADEIAARLNGDSVFRELNGRTINLHTNLKGKMKKVGKGADARVEFVESDKDIKDEDLKALRKLSRELDDGTSPYFCIVSVLMLREGWDVRNVTTIVPLRPYSSKAGILPEQTLGRGLRRMMPPGQANEIVVVIEHEAFARLYREELSQEGLPIEIVDVERIESTTVSIFPDIANKDATALDIAIPRLTAGNQTLPVLGPISEAEVRESFGRYKPLPLGGRGPSEVQYEGRNLITGELVEHMKVNLSLLESGVGAVSFYVQELEYIGKVRNTHPVLGPLVQWFFEEVLFGQKSSIFDAALVARLSDDDVREHVRAVFVPLIRRKTVLQQNRTLESQPVGVSTWKPFQVTVNERRPVHQSSRTLFNLVPCNRALELAFSELSTRGADVAAFAKNAGPQALRIDYLADGLRLAFYTPDFLVRLTNGRCLLVETKGQADRDVPAKARAAIEWCKAASLANGGREPTGAALASTKKPVGLRPPFASQWEYVYVLETVFQRYGGSSLTELARMCAPSLSDLINVTPDPQLRLFEAGEGKIDEVQSIVDEKLLAVLPERLRKAADEAITLYRFFESKSDVNHAPVFTALLGVIDEAAKGLVVQKLSPRMPTDSTKQRTWFEPYLDKVDPKTRSHYNQMAGNLRKTLVYRNGVSPLGLLRNCLDYALDDHTKLTGVFEALKSELRFTGARKLLDTAAKINDFRNEYVAHQKDRLTDSTRAKQALVSWIEGLGLFWQANLPSSQAQK